jgi:uncharacterized protein (DUF302 family)
MKEQHSGLVHVRTRYTVPETLDRLEELVRARGQTVFCRIDHGGEAAKVGLDMQQAQVLIFGNPKAGTPLMIAAPTLAIDLPLRALAWQDADGQVWLSYNDPEYLQQRHGSRLSLCRTSPESGCWLKPPRKEPRGKPPDAYPD